MGAHAEERTGTAVYAYSKRWANPQKREVWDYNLAIAKIVPAVFNAEAVRHSLLSLQRRA